MNPDPAALTVDELRRVVSKYTHDVNNALSIILGFSEFLASDGTGDAERQQDLQEIHRAAKEISMLTQDVRVRIGVAR